MLPIFFSYLLNSSIFLFFLFFFLCGTSPASWSYTDDTSEGRRYPGPQTYRPEGVRRSLAIRESSTSLNIEYCTSCSRDCKKEDIIPSWSIQTSCIRHLQWRTKVLRVLNYLRNRSTISKGISYTFIKCMRINSNKKILENDKIIHCVHLTPRQQICARACINNIGNSNCATNLIDANYNTSKYNLVLKYS